MNMNSVRSRPMPAAPASTTCSISIGNSTFACRLIGTPSRVTAGWPASWRKRAVLLLPFAAAASVLLQRHRRRMDDDLSEVAVDQDRIAGAHRLHQPGGAEHRRQTQGAGEDRGMPLGTAHLGGDADNVLGVELRGLRRREFLGDDDAAVGNREQRLAGFLGELRRPAGCRLRGCPRPAPTDRHPASSGSRRR